MRGIFPFIRNKLKNFTRGKKYRRAFVRVHPSTNLAMNNKKTRRNTNGKRNFRKDTRISWPGLRPLFSVERSCADEETGRGRGCWRTERERRRGKFRLVSLRFNRNPVRQHAGGDMCVYMGVYRLAHVAHYFQSRSQILNNPSVGKYVKYPKRLSTVCIVILVPRNPWHGYFYAPRFLFVLQSLCIKYAPSFFYKHFGQIDFLNIDKGLTKFDHSIGRI